jgi:cytochrome c556
VTKRGRSVMKKLILESGLLVTVIAATLAVALGADAARKLSTSAVMHKQYTVSNAPFVRIKKELNSETPDWAKVQEASRRFLALAESLEKNEPKWGDSASWKKQTSRHVDDAKAIENASGARDRDAVLAAQKRVSASCKGCHDTHRDRGEN